MLGPKGVLFKRKDFLECDEEAKSHPNRTYYYRATHRTVRDVDLVIEKCTRKLRLEPACRRRLSRAARRRPRNVGFEFY